MKAMFRNGMAIAEPAAFATPAPQRAANDTKSQLIQELVGISSSFMASLTAVGKNS
jgi:hypothetical protein